MIDYPTIDVPRSHMPVACCALLDGFNLHGLTQINSITNTNSRLLDLVLANETALPECSVFEASEPLINLDVHHPALETRINMSIPVLFENSVDAQSLDFRKADFDALANSLSHAN